jgi:hypothetical protein
MKRNRIACLLMLLLAWSWFDDAWASVVIGDDDSLAGDNDEFLQAQRHHSQAHSRHTSPVPTWPTDLLARQHPYPVTGGLSTAVGDTAHAGLSLLYLLMSLQC